MAKKNPIGSGDCQLCRRNDIKRGEGNPAGACAACGKRLKGLPMPQRNKRVRAMIYASKP